MKLPRSSSIAPLTLRVAVAAMRRGRADAAAVLIVDPSPARRLAAARVLAGELGLDLLRIDLSGAVNRYLDETEAALRAAFRSAGNGALLFLDEADALFGKRDQGGDERLRRLFRELAAGAHAPPSLFGVAGEDAAAPGTASHFVLAPRWPPS